MRDGGIYILGTGAIGLALAATLIKNGEDVLLVRTSNDNVSKSELVISAYLDDNSSTAINMDAHVISLSQLGEIQGIIVVTAKAYANQKISEQLKAIGTESPILILQNGIGVEKPFLSANFHELYRCVLYATSQKTSRNQVRFRQIASSPIGLIEGSINTLKSCITRLSTTEFPFHFSQQIQEAIWKKAIINSVFNTICPLLDVDNGIFFRNSTVAQLADEIVEESIGVAHALGLNLAKTDIMRQVLKISKTSTGQLISTLQDLNSGNRTEIDYLNLEIARVAESLTPKIEVKRTRLLGELIQLKSFLSITQDESELI